MALDDKNWRLSTPRFEKIPCSIGILVGTFEDDLVEISFHDSKETLIAKCNIPTSENDFGRSVLLEWPQESDATPTVLSYLSNVSCHGSGGPSEEDSVIDVPGRKLTLQCGKASITLTREGKIILRGTYISSRSSGVNRIKGGSVQLN